MSKITTTLIFFLISSAALAGNLTPQEVRERLEIRADIYLTDSTGEKILSGPERTNYWKFNPDKGSIKGDWSSRFSAGFIGLRHNWEVLEDGSIRVSIEEFAGESDKQGRPEFKESLGKKEFKLKNFEPVVWEVKNIKNQKFVVRYLPTIKEISSPINIDSLPVAGTQISITDNNGYLWADDVELNGKFAGVTSHRGTLIISYSPFSGGKEMGIAEGNLINLKVDKKFEINLRAGSAFLPAGVKAKVYAFYNPDKKSNGVNSLRSFDTGKQERLKEIMQK